MTKKIRTYSELCTLPTFEERYDYLKLNTSVGIDTFGFDRYLNQSFYKSTEWKRVRDKVIVRDLGRDLGIEGREINGTIYIHHMNPITVDDISNSTDFLLNPEYLVCVSLNTHNAIHYGNKDTLRKIEFAERTKNDTCPWKKV